MAKFIWDSSEKKRQEWTFAKEQLIRNGKLLPNGTKLRKKDHPQNLKHSFMVIDDRILAVSEVLGRGATGHAKLAEDETGQLFALKVITREEITESNSTKESEIAQELGIAGQCVTRNGVWKGFSQKHYIAYQYLGKRLEGYLRNNLLSLDERYELCIKISLALHELHTGKRTKSRKGYWHKDIHSENLVIDDEGQPHFIDFGQIKPALGQNHQEIIDLLSLFLNPRPHFGVQDWVFGNIKGNYSFSRCKPKFDENDSRTGKCGVIYLYVEYSDKGKDGFYHNLHYMIKDLGEPFQHGVLNLDDLSLMKLPVLEEGDEEGDWDRNLDFNDPPIIEKKILELAEKNKHIGNQKYTNAVLFKLFDDPKAFYNTSGAPTALDVAETLTLCRLQMETYQASLIKLPSDLREEIIHLLNSVSSKILKLYGQLDDLFGVNSELKQRVKTDLVAHCINKKENPVKKIVLNEEETLLLQQSINDLLMDIDHARESWRIKNQQYLEKKPDLSSQSKPKKTKVISPRPDELKTNEPATPKSKLPALEEPVNNRPNGITNQQEEAEKNTRINGIINRIDYLLGDFHRKAIGISNHFPEAKTEAMDLYKSLKRARDKYEAHLQGKLFIYGPAEQLFKEHCKIAIDKAMPILERDLGWGEYLKNVLKSIVNAIFYVATTGRTSAFFPYATSDISKAAAKVKEELQGNDEKIQTPTHKK